MNNDELIAAGHELAKCLDNEPLLDIAKLLSKMANQLDVTTAALREKTKQCEQVAQAVGWVDGGNFTLAEAVAGHVSGLKAATQRSEELAAENSALKNYRPQPQGVAMMTALDAFFEHEDVPEQGMIEAFEILFCKQPETPATDAFLREVQVSAVDAVCLKISNSIVSCRQDEMIGLDEAVNIASDFAVELRQGGAA
ncbi:hypothetical protein CDT97_10235 [Cronobacter sakazakii]|uniref:hypothetical protein n=1 Tax=Cronobacter sakazakii TaxID=28141 RepID=UPI000BE9978A|nr:hypothetical protein [Cronobacter sakazakii]PQV67632.1 hypothetical protein CDT97_10235 [Cronobacter sakazakii]